MLFVLNMIHGVDLKQNTQTTAEEKYRIYRD